MLGLGVGSGEQAVVSARVVSDHEASGDGELSVKRNELVTIVVDVGSPAPQGWCYCQAARADSERGLVPWLCLATDEAPPSPHSSPNPQPPAGMTLMRNAPDSQGGLWFEIVLRRSGGGRGGLGLDIDENNCVRRVSPGSAADTPGGLQPGDVIHHVDGKPLAGFCLATIIDPSGPAYLLRVWRPPFDATRLDELQEGVMSTLKLQRVAQGMTLPRGDLHVNYVSHAGRQVETSNVRERIARARSRSSFSEQLDAASTTAGATPNAAAAKGHSSHPANSARDDRATPTTHDELTSGLDRLMADLDDFIAQRGKVRALPLGANVGGANGGGANGVANGLPDGRANGLANGGASTARASAWAPRLETVQSSRCAVMVDAAPVEQPAANSAASKAAAKAAAARAAAAAAASAAYTCYTVALSGVSASSSSSRTATSAAAAQLPPLEATPAAETAAAEALQPLQPAAKSVPPPSDTAASQPLNGVHHALPDGSSGGGGGGDGGGGDGVGARLGFGAAPPSVSVASCAVPPRTSSPVLVAAAELRSPRQLAPAPQPTRAARPAPAIHTGVWPEGRPAPTTTPLPSSTVFVSARAIGAPPAKRQPSRPSVGSDRQTTALSQRSALDLWRDLSRNPLLFCLDGRDRSARRRSGVRTSSSFSADTDSLAV